MAGFPLMAFGAGLGKFAESYNQQQEARARNAMLALTLAKYQRELDADKIKDQASDAFSSFDFGSLGGGIKPVVPAPGAGSGGYPGASSLPDSLTMGRPTPVASPPSRGDVLGTVDDRWLMQNLPMGLGNGPAPPAGTLPWRAAPAPPDAYAALSGPGAPVGGGTGDPGPIPPPRTGINAPPQMAQAAPQPGTPAQQQQSPIPGLAIPPPERFDFGAVMQKLKEMRPGYSQRALVEAAKMVQQRLGENYKAEFDRWAKLTDFGLRQQGQAETGRHNRATEADQRRQREQQDTSLGFEDRKTTVLEKGQKLEYEDKAAGRELERGRLTDAERRTQIAKDVAEGRLTKIQGQQKLAVSEARSLAERARYLYEAVESNPNLVGARGWADRIRGSVTEQAKLGVTHKQLSEFQSEVNLLRAQVLKGLNINKYMTKGAMEELKKLVPSDEALTSPTQAKAALRNLARVLEENAERAEAVMGGVTKDYEGMSTEELFKMLGQSPPGAQ